MERAPRRYVASCVSIHSLEVRGPAYLAYWPTSSARPSLLGQTELLAGDDLESLVSSATWRLWNAREPALGPIRGSSGCAQGQMVAVAGY